MDQPRRDVEAAPDVRKVPRPKIRAGVVLPRLETPRTKGVKSLGPEAADMIDKSGVLGRYKLLPWQRYALDRSLELRPDGSLRWRVVIITVARQQGKSTLMRGQTWWRMHQGERFDEPQLVIHVANLSRTSKEVWAPAARRAAALYGKGAAKFGKGSEEIDLTEWGHGRWLLAAADENAGIGLSPTQANVDEAWNIDRLVVEDALEPGTSEREQPQIYLYSTAGDSKSDLLQHYRELALQDVNGTGDVLLLEWSAPPELPYDHPNTWRWASPNWSPRRERFLSGVVAKGKESRFRTQYLNQWVQAVGGMIEPSVWAASYDKEHATGSPDVLCVECSPDGSRLAAVSVWTLDDKLRAHAMSTMSASALWEHINQAKPRTLLLPPTMHIHYRGRQRATMVGTSELGKHLPGVIRAINDGRVLHHPDDHVLTSDIGCAVAVNSETGLRMSIAKSTGPTEAARALVQAVGEAIAPKHPRPRFRSVAV